MDHSPAIRRLARRGWWTKTAAGLAAPLVLALLVVAAVATTTATADDNPRTHRHHHGTHARRPAKLQPAVPSQISDASPAGLDAFIRAQMAKTHLPGLAACVVADGDIVWAKGYGWANIEQGRPVTPDTGFMIASVSKTVIATAVMHLVEAGGVSLSADIDSYLPFPVRNPAHPDVPITLFQLLTHTSSIRDDFPLMRTTYVWDVDSPISLHDFCEGYLVPGGSYYSAGHYSAEPPASTCSYSNLGSSLAALVVEEVSGMPFDQYCQTHIFAPLRMNTTSWKLAGMNLRTLAMPYGYDAANQRFTPLGHYCYPDYPDGQLRTSVSQLGRFLALYTKGGIYRNVRLLRPATVTQMTTPQTDLSPDQALLWDSQFSFDRDVVGKPGGDRGVRAEMWYEPATGYGVVVLINGNGSWAWAEPFVHRLFDEAPNF